MLQIMRRGGEGIKQAGVIKFINAFNYTMENVCNDSLLCNRMKGLVNDFKAQGIQ